MFSLPFLFWRHIIEVMSEVIRQKEAKISIICTKNAH